MTLDHFIIAVYCWIAENIEACTNGQRLRGAGFPPSLPDAEALTIVVVGERSLGYQSAIANGSIIISDAAYDTLKKQKRARENTALLTFIQKGEYAPLEEENQPTLVIIDPKRKEEYENAINALKTLGVEYQVKSEKEPDGKETRYIEIPAEQFAKVKAAAVRIRAILDLKEANEVRFDRQNRLPPAPHSAPNPPHPGNAPAVPRSQPHGF